MATPVTAEDFLTAFQTRHAYCRALLDLSAEQSALIEADEYSALIELLNHKQQLLDALWDVGRQPVDLWAAWTTQRHELPAPVRQQCEDTLAKTELLLRELTLAEQSSAERLTIRRDATERALGTVQHGGAASAAYGSLSDVVASRRLDVNS